MENLFNGENCIYVITKDIDLGENKIKIKKKLNYYGKS